MEGELPASVMRSDMVSSALFTSSQSGRDILTLLSFWSYEWAKQSIISPSDTEHQTALKIMLCGGLAGIVTWASVFPLDVIKTRVQTQLPRGHSYPNSAEHQSLLRPESGKRLTTFEVARHAYQTEGAKVFFRGLGVCSVRAFIVNAVQWAVYEWMMVILRKA